MNPCFKCRQDMDTERGAVLHMRTCVGQKDWPPYLETTLGFKCVRCVHIEEDETAAYAHFETHGVGGTLGRQGDDWQRREMAEAAVGMLTQGMRAPFIAPPVAPAGTTPNSPIAQAFEASPTQATEWYCETHGVYQKSAAGHAKHMGSKAHQPVAVGA